MIRSCGYTDKLLLISLPVGCQGYMCYAMFMFLQGDLMKIKYKTAAFAAGQGKEEL